MACNCDQLLTGYPPFLPLSPPPLTVTDNIQPCPCRTRVDIQSASHACSQSTRTPSHILPQGFLPVRLCAMSVCCCTPPISRRCVTSSLVENREIGSTQQQSVLSCVLVRTTNLSTSTLVATL